MGGGGLGWAWMGLGCEGLGWAVIDSVATIGQLHNGHDFAVAIAHHLSLSLHVPHLPWCTVSAVRECMTARGFRFAVSVVHAVAVCCLPAHKPACRLPFGRGC